MQVTQTTTGLFAYRLRLFLLVSGLGVAVGVSWTLFTHRVYVTAATFVPQTSESSASGLALAASQFGISIPGAGSSWGPAVYVALLRSRSIHEPLLDLSFPVDSSGAKTASIAQLFELEAPTSARLAHASLRQISSILKVREDAKLGAVRFTVTSPSPYFSKALADTLLAVLNTFNLESRRSQAVAERRFLENQVLLAATDLRKAEDELQQFLQRNRIIEPSTILEFERERLRRIADGQRTMLEALQRNLEEAKLKEVRDTPVLTLLEEPKLALVPESRRLVLKVILGLFLAHASMLCFVGFRHLRRGAAEAGLPLGAFAFSEAKRLLARSST